MSRHNVGFMAVALLAERYSIRLRKPLFRRLRIGEAELAGERLVLAEPLTYMNRSGEVVPDLLRSFRLGLDSLLVVCDTLDLPVGACRLRPSGGSAGHHGLESVAAAVGSTDFARLVVGIGRPSGGEVIDHVLGTLDEAEMQLIERAIARAADAAVELLRAPISQVMNDFNQRNSPPRPQS